MKETLWKGKKEESYADADSTSIKKKGWEEEGGREIKEGGMYSPEGLILQC